jgi:hypothetical protein
LLPPAAVDEAFDINACDLETRTLYQQLLHKYGSTGQQSEIVQRKVQEFIVSMTNGGSTESTPGSVSSGIPPGVPITEFNERNSSWPHLDEDVPISSIEPNHLNIRASLPAVVLKGDIDSVYKTAPTARDIVDAVGKKFPWTLDSSINSFTAEKGSRYSVNSSKTSEPAFLKGGKCRTVPMEWFPNVKIAWAKIWDHEMHMHIYYMGVKNFSRKTYFSYLMLAVVNAMMNYARQAVSDQFSEDESAENTIMASEFKLLKRFETKVGPKDWSRSMLSRRTTISHQSMCAFADALMVGLNKIASDDTDFEFDTPVLHGWNSISCFKRNKNKTTNYSDWNGEFCQETKEQHLLHCINGWMQVTFPG